jgi:inner membrane protein
VTLRWTLTDPGVSSGVSWCRSSSTGRQPASRRHRPRGPVLVALRAEHPRPDLAREPLAALGSICRSSGAAAGARRHAAHRLGPRGAALMASVISHAVVCVGAWRRRVAGVRMPARYWVTLAIMAALPDLDVVVYPARLNAPHILGHRGITHSLPFAAVFAALVVRLVFRGRAWRPRGSGCGLVFFAAMASHGVLDAMTNGGQGIAFFAPVLGRALALPVAADPRVADRRRRVLLDRRACACCRTSCCGVAAVGAHAWWRAARQRPRSRRNSRLAAYRARRGGPMRRILMLLMAIIPAGCAPADPPRPARLSDRRRPGPSWTTTAAQGAGPVPLDGVARLEGGGRLGGRVERGHRRRT